MLRRFSRQALTALPAAALMLTTGAAAEAAPSIAASAPGWRTVATLSRQSILLGVAAVDRKHAWAVGFGPSGQKLVLIVEAWNGSSWAQVSLPASTAGDIGEIPELVTAAASSPRNFWAFTPLGGWLHYNGTAWTAGSKLGSTPVNLDTSLAAGSDTWVFGGTVSGKQATPYAAYNTGTSAWKRTSVPGTGVLTAASAVSPGDIWAVAGARLVHWYRGQWHAVASLPASLRPNGAEGLLAHGDKGVWVGGAVKNSKKGTTEAFAHWNGRRWAVVTVRVAVSAADFRAYSMVSDGSGGIWALSVCEGGNCPSGGAASRLWHESAGRWIGPVVPRLAKRASVLLGLAGVGHSVWGVGGIRTGNGATGLIALWGAAPR
jgi:hypothetical protein